MDLFGILETILGIGIELIGGVIEFALGLLF